MKRLPAASNATTSGLNNVAAVACPPSPLRLADPVPATVVITLGGAVHFSYHVVTIVANEQVASRVNRDPERLI